MPKGYDGRKQNQNTESRNELKSVMHSRVAPIVPIDVSDILAKEEKLTKSSDQQEKPLNQQEIRKLLGEMGGVWGDNTQLIEALTADHSQNEKESHPNLESPPSNEVLKLIQHRFIEVNPASTLPLDPHPQLVDKEYDEKGNLVIQRMKILDGYGSPMENGPKIRFALRDVLTPQERLEHGIHLGLGAVSIHFPKEVLNVDRNIHPYHTQLRAIVNKYYPNTLPSSHAFSSFFEAVEYGIERQRVGNWDVNLIGDLASKAQTQPNQ